MSLSNRIKLAGEPAAVWGLLLVAVLLRIPTLGSPLTEDEAISFNRYGHLPWHTILFFYQDTNQHSLLLMLSNLCMGLFGDHETVFRLPSFLAGVVSIPLMYLLGRSLLHSQRAALVASFLLAVSASHIKYSQEGRAYALTVLLALLLVWTVVRMVETRRYGRWGTGIVVSGLALVVALPSNAFFLAAAGVTAWIASWLREPGSGILSRNRIKDLSPFLVLLILVCVYFYRILPGLSAGLHRHPLELDLPRFMRIGEFLTAPWGTWVFLFFLFGCWCLRKKAALWPFLVIFLMPVGLTFISGVVGFARVYIYWIPFVLMPAGLGMVECFDRIRSFNLKAGYGFLAVGLPILLIQPAGFLSTYYPDRVHGRGVVAGPNATLAEARQMADWVNEHVDRSTLVVIMVGGPESSVLNHYLADRIRDSMLEFARGKDPKRIVVIAHRGMPPQDYPLKSANRDRQLNLPEHLFRPVHDLGNLRVYDLALNIIRFNPPAFDADYMADLQAGKSEQVQIEVVDDPALVGDTSLVVRNRIDQQISLRSPVTKIIDVNNDDTYVLFVYLAQYGYQVMIIFGDPDNWPPTIGYLNYYRGLFKFADSGVIWQPVYSLSHLPRGRNNLREVFQIQPDQIGRFDGIQAFILIPEES